MSLLGILGLGGLAAGSGYVGTRIGNAINKWSTPPKGAQLTPYAIKRAEELGGWDNVNYLAIKKLREQEQARKNSSSGSGGSGGSGGYGYGGYGGGSGIPSYQDAMDWAGGYADKYFNPYEEYVKKSEKDTLKRYNEYSKTQEKMLPLIQQRYAALLDQIKTSMDTQRGDIQEQETSQLGRQQARAAARGTYGSSVMEGQEQMISRATQDALSTLAADERSKNQELSAAQGLEEESVYDKMRQILLGGEDRAEDIRGLLYAMFPQKGAFAQGLAGGYIDTEATRADQALQGYLASLKSGGSAGANTTIKTMWNPQTRQNEEALIDETTGEILNWVGASEQGYGIDEDYARLGRELEYMQTPLNTQDAATLKRRYPGLGDYIDSITEKSSFWDNLFGRS